MPEQTPTIGRIVHYTLTEADASVINKRRADSDDHMGNHASAGDTYPAVVVRTFGGPAANLKVLLDGTDTHWATSRCEGEGAGFWAWPPRVGG
jgi:hypothetical protein